MNYLKISNSYFRNFKQLQKVKNKIYILAIIFGIILIFSSPFVAHADLFGFEIQDVYVDITESVQDTNDILNKAFQFSQTSPYEIVNKLYGTTQGNITINVRNATKTMALVVATLLLMVDFFRKSINFEWSSKWENILLFLIKIIVVKQVVQNADIIVGYIYSGFQSINKAAVGSNINFLPCDDTIDYYCRIKQTVLEQLHKSWWDFWYDKGASANYNEYYYQISPSAVKMFYPNATFPATNDLTVSPFANPTTRLNFMPTLEIAFLQPYFLVMKALAYVIFVISIGRVFELAVYTIFAPLPLATFASDTTHDVAKSFLKNYIATVLQIAVIVIMFMIYVAVNKYIIIAFINTKLIQFVVLISLTLSVVKSGAWSKKICGIG